MAVVYLNAEATGETSTPSVSLSLDTADDIDIDSALWYIDRDTGNVWEREPQEGNDTTTGWVEAGRFTPSGDGEIPAAVTGLSATAITVQQPDGTTVPAFVVSWSLNSETDIVQYEIEYDISPASWGTPQHLLVGGDVASATTGPVLGGTSYDFRVRALDLDATPGGWSATYTASSLSDAIPPAMPTGLSANAGYRLVGLSWNRNTEPDLAFYQVRFYEGSTPSADPHNETTVQYLTFMTNHAVISNLAPDTAYMFSVRAVDRSGNVSSVSSTFTLEDSANYRYGWCTEVTATPTSIGSSDVAFNSIVANFVSTGTLSADSITSGTLSVGGTGNAISFTVYDTLNQQMMTISDDGLTMWSTTDEKKALWLTGDGLRFSDDFTGDVGTTTWSTAINASGINASAITFGTETGGHNRVANAGMESTSFATVAPSTKVWTSSADWGTASNAVNLNTGGASLTMTSV